MGLQNNRWITHGITKNDQLINAGLQKDRRITAGLHKKSSDYSGITCDYIRITSGLDLSTRGCNFLRRFPKKGSVASRI